VRPVGSPASRAAPSMSVRVIWMPGEGPAPALLRGVKCDSSGGVSPRCDFRRSWDFSPPFPNVEGSPAENGSPDPSSKYMVRRSVLFLLLAGCAARSSMPVPEPDASRDIQAEHAGWTMIAEAAITTIPAAEQKKLVEADVHYHLALAAFDRGDFDKGREEARLAVQIWPEYLPARQLLADVREVVGADPSRLRDIGGRESRGCRVTVDQARIEITDHILKGGRYMDAHLYSRALMEFEDAEFKIVSLPDYVTTMNPLLPEVRSMAARAKSSVRD